MSSMEVSQNLTGDTSQAFSAGHP